jgi:cyclic-di-GMP-binding protein
VVEDGLARRVFGIVIFMAQQNTFDIVSSIDLAEVVNAINQALKEVQTRFDFKGSLSNIEMEGKDSFILTSDDEYKLRSLDDILQSKFVKRGVPLKGLNYQKVEQALGGTVRQKVLLQQGIPQDKAKEIVKHIKDTKLKVQASIQGDLVRVAGKDRDILQEVIGALKQKDFGIDMQFTNYRSN